MYMVRSGAQETMVGLLLLQSLRTRSQEGLQKRYEVGLKGQSKVGLEKQVGSHEESAYRAGNLLLASRLSLESTYTTNMA